MYRSIYVDQCGYLPTMEKNVTFKSDKPVNFAVITSDGRGVYSGTADKRVENASANETDYIGSFSAVTAPGKYYIVADGHGESETFTICDSVYEDVFQKSTAFFYLQRCGYNFPVAAAGEYAHPACHTQIASAYEGTDTRDVSGGWHDAGDFGRYIVPGAMAVAQMLYAYERNEKLCASYHCPEALSETNLPDYLEEIKYELDWMMKLQREDGALYHKATCKKFCSFIMPDQEKDPMVLSPVSVTATADFAAACAMAIRFYEKYDSAYAAKLAEVSKKAYEAMKTIVLPGGFRNPPDISTGEYEDANDKDELYWAAAELYKAFGDAEYRNDFEALAKENIFHGYGWSAMGSYGNLAYLSCNRDTDSELVSKIKDSMIKVADRLLKITTEDGYGTSLLSTEYVWGSNMSVTNNGIMLYDAYVLTGDQKYLNAAGEQLHYVLGRNPMGVCYVTGCGTYPIKRPHHRPSGVVGKAMPGMISGGPCSWIADEAIKSLFTRETAPAPAKCLVDMTGSYSTNEVTIYWNSSLLQLLASVIA